MIRRYRMIIAAVAVLTSSLAWAHSGATGIVDQRMKGMKSLSDATKALGALKAGAIPFSAETLHLAATEIALHGKAAKELFPEGSLKSPSEALPLVWDDKATFNRLFDEMVEAAEKTAANR